MLVRAGAKCQGHLRSSLMQTSQQESTHQKPRSIITDSQIICQRLDLRHLDCLSPIPKLCLRDCMHNDDARTSQLSSTTTNWTQKEKRTSRD